MENEKRMAGDYKITYAIHIGDKEVVFGEYKNAEPIPRYMCSFCVTNEIFVQYSECMVGDDYLEIMELFTERLQGQIEMVRTMQIPDMEVITADMCVPDSRDVEINGKVVAMKAEVLRPEYRHANHQLCLVTGGFGASANSRGNAVSCVNLHTGKHTRVERYDVLGEIKPEHMPEWAKERLSTIQVERANAKKSMEKER